MNPIIQFAKYYLLTTSLLLSTAAVAQTSGTTNQKKIVELSFDDIVLEPIYRTDSKTYIFRNAVNIVDQSSANVYFNFYRLLLSSLMNPNRFSLFVPVDSTLNSYVDPIAYGQTGTQGMLKFWVNAGTSLVNATVYKYDAATGVMGDSVGVISDQSFIKNRLTDLLKNHFFVGEIQPNKKFYITRGNDIIKIENTGTLQIKGGGDLAKNTVVNPVNIFNKENGITYFINKPIEPSLKSVYKILSETPEFSAFFQLIAGIPTSIDGLQDAKGNNMMDSVQLLVRQGIDYRIGLFNAYRYTVYVPTNEAIQNAITNGTITPWPTILAMTDKTQKWLTIKKLIKLLSYHFQDEAVFVDETFNGKFSTASLKTDNDPTHLGTARNKFYKIQVEGTAASTKLTTDTKLGETVRTAYIVKNNGLYNLIAKDYIFGKIPSGYKNVDGTGNASGALFSTSTIVSSSCVIIHQIDNVLNF